MTYIYGAGISGDILAYQMNFVQNVEGGGALAALL